MNENLFEMFFDPDKEGVTAISLVTDPAIEVDFFAFNNETSEVKQVTPLKSDEAKQMIIAPAMIPNKQIYRQALDGYVFFSEDSIQKFAYEYLKHFNHNTTLEHKVKVDEGIYVVESWIVESENDKAYDYGFDVPKGTWMVKMHVENPILWDKYIASGELKGFSVEMFAGVKQIKTKTEMKKNAMLELFSKFLDETIKEVEVIKIGEYEVAEFKEGVEVLKDGQRVDETITLEYDGKVAVVENGIIVSIDEVAPIEEEPIEEMEEEPKEEEVPAEEIVDPIEEAPIEEEVEEEMEVEVPAEPTLEQKLQEEIIEKTAEIEALKAEIEALKAEKAKVEEDFEAFKAETPASNGVNIAPKKKVGEESFLEYVRNMRK